MNKISFEDLEGADLIVDCIYEGGNPNNWSGEPLRKLLPKGATGGTGGGFRRVNRKDGTGKPAYIVLYTDMSQLEWPDYLDYQTGIFRYYGDNKKPGRELTDTHFGGNKLLEEVFDTLNTGESLGDIPPFFVFKKAGTGRDKQFLGLAAPGNPEIDSDEDLVAFWRSKDGKRFQNYRAYFTILNTGKKPISQDWLVSLIEDHENNLKYAPDVWKNFIEKGRKGIKALTAEELIEIPSRQKQLDCGDKEREKCLDIIYNRYKEHRTDFEAFALALIPKIDSNFIDIEPTRPVRDGGRDGIGKYEISVGGNSKTSLRMDFSMEAKLKDKGNCVNVHDMARLISRLRHRQFGILITNSCVGNQTYEEVLEDKHPILIITASDIAEILRLNNIDSKNINELLDNIDNGHSWI